MTKLASADIDVEAMDTDELRKLTLHLRDSLKAREVQLERKFEEVAHMQEVTHRLMVSPPSAMILILHPLYFLKDFLLQLALHEHCCSVAFCRDLAAGISRQ